MSLSVIIATGGTGGHMVPAHALSEALQHRGVRVTLLTDARGLRFPGLFQGVARHVLDSASASGGNPIGWLKAAIAVRRGRAAGILAARDAGANAVVGFGGYPSLPGLLAGAALKLPIILHEQNAVLGRVNRRMQSRVTAIAITYADTAGLNPALRTRTHLTGNPVRADVLAARAIPFNAPAPAEPFRLLVTGGSQGARILAQHVPAAVAALDPGARSRIRVAQQCRPEDLSEVAGCYTRAGVEAECLPYMADLPERMAAAHLVIARAGASTVAELTAMGRPAILVPFQAAMDDHQAANAAEFARAGAGHMIREADLSDHGLAGHLAGFMASPETLAGCARAARALGHPDAATLLADLVHREISEAGERIAA